MDAELHGYSAQQQEQTLEFVVGNDDINEFDSLILMTIVLTLHVEL